MGVQWKIFGVLHTFTAILEPSGKARRGIFALNVGPISEQFLTYFQYHNQLSEEELILII